MAIWGADVQQLRDLGNKLQQGASEIETQKSNLNKVLQVQAGIAPSGPAIGAGVTGQPAQPQAAPPPAPAPPADPPAPGS